MASTSGSTSHTGTSASALPAGEHNGAKGAGSPPARRSTGKSRTAARARLQKEPAKVSLPLVGEIALPEGSRVAFYGGLTAFAILGLLDWPVALIVGAGHLLTENRHNETLEALGEVLEEA